MSSCNLDLDVWPVTGAIDDWLGRLPAGERFIGRAEAQGAVRAVSVVPCRERVKPVLDAAGRTDVTDHGMPSEHPYNPHFHPWNGPNDGWGDGQPIDPNGGGGQ